MDEIKRQNKNVSKKEEKRYKEFEKKVNELIKDGYERKDLTVSLQYANIMALVYPTPFALLFAILYFFVFNNKFTGYSVILFVVLLILLVVVHELIHGITWALFSKRHFKDIDFGFVPSELTPYCTCVEFLTKYQYILGSVMPFIILGIIPSIVALFVPNGLLFLISIIMMFAAGGDLTIMVLILKNKSKKKSVLYIDHPINCGVVMFDK